MSSHICALSYVILGLLALLVITNIFLAVKRENKIKRQNQEFKKKQDNHFPFVG
jgi:bacteriorhodopsin